MHSVQHEFRGQQRQHGRSAQRTYRHQCAPNKWDDPSTRQMAMHGHRHAHAAKAPVLRRQANTMCTNACCNNNRLATLANALQCALVRTSNFRTCTIASGIRSLNCADPGTASRLIPDVPE
eukprot:11499985-Alexandrium_andersonii.AAC.1